MLVQAAPERGEHPLLAVVWVCHRLHGMSSEQSAPPHLETNRDTRMLADDRLPIGGYPDGVQVPGTCWAGAAKQLPSEVSLGTLAPKNQAVEAEKSGEVGLAERTHLPG
jgi:hypothetical protein